MIQSETYEERAWKAEAKVKELEAENDALVLGEQPTGDVTK